MTTRCSARARAGAIQTMALLSPANCTRATGTACDAHSVISAARSQVSRLFTGPSMTQTRDVYRSQRAVSDLCFGENWPAAARR